MNFKKKLEIIDRKETTVFEWNFNKKNYHLRFNGQGRRVKSFEWLLEAYPDYFNVHDPKITKKYDDSNKAVNELIHDEGFNGFVFEKKDTSSIGKKNKVKSYKLDLEIKNTNYFTKFDLKGKSSHFDWHKYLNETNSKQVPDDFFKNVN
jgi:hypothetical protein